MAIVHANSPHSEHQSDHRILHDLEDALHAAAHHLPAQGPIGVFVHHNTLHAWQHLPFHEAVVQAAQHVGARPWLPEEEWRAAWAAGRISRAALREAIETAPDAATAKAWPRGAGRAMAAGDARMLWIQHAPTAADGGAVEWLTGQGGFLDGLPPWVAEGVGTGRAAFEAELTEVSKSWHRRQPEVWLPVLAGASGKVGEARFMERFGTRPDPVGFDEVMRNQRESVMMHRLWGACHDIAAKVPFGRPTPHALWPPSRAHAVAHGADDPFRAVTPLLARLSSAFLDEGVAHWSMPDRADGFWKASIRALQAGIAFDLGVPAPESSELQRLLEGEPRHVIGEVFASWGVPASAFEAAIHSVLQLLPGWAGMFHRLETMPHERTDTHFPVSLLDWLAVALVVCDATLRTGSDVATQAPLRAPVAERALNLCHAALLLGLTPTTLAAMPLHEATTLVDAIEACGPAWRCRLWHDAAELHHQTEILSALDAHRRQRRDPVGPVRPRIEVTVCIDDREESFRRALEALGPDVRTHGHAGFFGFPVRFQGVDDHAAYPLCPVNIDPTVLVEERVGAAGIGVERTRVERRRLAARAFHEVHEAARTPGRGTLLTLALAPVQGLLLAARVIDPRRARRLERDLARRLAPPPATELTIERRAETPPPSPTGKPLQIGFTSEELVTRAATLLENLGATSNLGRLFVILGHGSGSFNNPHRSAYDCGACGGRHGAANARIAATVLNRPDIRSALGARGIDVPADTWFIGGFHHTGDDGVTLFDLETVPATHRDDLHRLVADLDTARAENAFERCRRFESATRVSTPAAALKHVESRCDHLAEPRPELGHATNAVAVVGRRDLTRGLFLDRRAFLVCHDPTRDPGTRILERLLAAVGPVGAGINLEYWFSRVDNDRYGAGTKLPHNVSGLIGVVSGAGGDLRTGLPWQMVEIHDPLRLLLVIEATPEAVLAVAGRQPEVAQLVVNGWVRVATVDPDSGAMHVFRNGTFVPWTAPTDMALAEVPDSRSHWRGHLGHLPPARIVGSLSSKDIHHA